MPAGLPVPRCAAGVHAGRHLGDLPVFLDGPGPDDVLAKFADASKAILAKEMDKGPKAKEMGDKLIGLMKDLGYA